MTTAPELFAQALAAHQTGRLDVADNLYRRALAADDAFAAAHINLGMVLHARGLLDAAIDCYRLGIERDATSAVAHNNLGRALHEQGKFAEAVECFQRSLAIDAQPASTHDNLGLALQALGRPIEAEAHHRRAIALQPQYVTARNSLGSALEDQARYAEAEASFRQALALNPNFAAAHLNLALVLLRCGNFAEGWQEYEWRWACNPSLRRDFLQPQWDGRPLPQGRVLIHAEQGLGDLLQFVRYMPLVKQRVGRVFVECPRAMIPLLARCAGIDAIIPRGDVLPGFDCHLPLLSLPRIFGTDVSTIPHDVPYLFVDPQLTYLWSGKVPRDGVLNVGICWQGHPANPSQQRSIPLRMFEHLASVPGVRLFSLQKLHGLEQVAELRNRFELYEFGPSLDEEHGAFTDTAAIMQNLDLVVTSDTAIPHLAGGLGIPAWLAVPFIPEWRWQIDRPDSPWYPTLRLFRQKTLGDWETVFRQMATELTVLT